MTQRKTSIALDLSDSDRQALYDDHAKRLLGYRRVLAAFLKQVLPELKPYPAGQIVTMIDPDIRISTKILHPDLKIRGLNTEYREKLRHRQDLPADESKGIRFDILFRVQLPAGAREILINIEIQKDKPKDYELLPRAVSYLGELIASQTDREYVAQDYDRLMPVCSIWIVAGQDRNTITAYNLTEKTTGEPDMWGKAELVQAVILGFNEESKPEPGEEPVWNLLRGLFSTTMSVVDRLGILEDYGIPTVQDVEEEVLDMCNLGQGVYEKGKRAGELQGIEQGIEQGHTESEQRISRLKHLMMEADRTEEFLAALDDPRRCTGCTGNSASSLIEADAGRMSMEVSTKIRKHLWAAAVFCAVLLGGCRADMSFSQQQMPSVDMPDGLVQGLQHAASRNDADSAQDTAPVQQEQPAPDPDTVPAVSEQSSDVQLQEVMHPVSRCVQETGWYCGPAVMQMLLSHYGIAASQPDLARQLHTSQVTGTEYADMARVASVQVFGREPGNDGEPGFRAWTGTENAMTPQDQEQFLARANRDLTTGDVLSAAVDVGTLYPELNIRGAHVVLINGARQDKNGHICQLRLEDPSYLVDYGTEEEHWVDADRFLNAMNRCPEPGYIW